MASLSDIAKKLNKEFKDDQMIIKSNIINIFSMVFTKIFENMTISASPA